MKYFKKMVGERVYLSPMNPADVELYTKWLNDYAVSGFLGDYSQNFSLQMEQEYLEQHAAKEHNYAIVRLEDNALLGSVGLGDLDHITRKAAIGILIGEAENRGKGYGMEAMRLLLHYGFNTLNLHNIMLYVHADNTRGIACYERLGFKEFGRRRDGKFKDGRYVDLVHMDLLDHEFNTGN